MANDSSEILVGASGHVYVAPVGSTSPTDSDTTLDTAFQDLGFVSEAGVTFTDSKDLESVLAWQSFYPVRRIVTGREAMVSFALRQWNSDTLALALGGGDVRGMKQLITLTGFSGTDTFKLTYNAIEGGTTFTRGTNATAAAIQAALRTATSDTTLTVSGTTDAGPFTVTFTAGFNVLSAVTVTSGSGVTGATTYLQTEYVPPSPEDIDEHAMVIEWTDGTRDYRLLMEKGMVSEGVETNITRTSAADLPITFAATPDTGDDAYVLFTNDPAFA